MARQIQTYITIGSTATRVLAQSVYQPDYIRFVNDSDEAIYIKIGEDAVLNEGIRINANGGEYVMKRGENMPAGYVSAICTSGSKKLLVYAIGARLDTELISVYDSISLAENLGKLNELNVSVNDAISVAEDLTISNLLLQAAALVDSISVGEDITIEVVTP